MKPQAFEEANRAEWSKLEQQLAALAKREPADEAHRLPHLFRRVCGDLALAQHRMYGRQLCDRLNGLVISGYQELHRALNRGSEGFMRFVSSTLPRAVRGEWRLFWLTMAIFWVPFFAFIIAAHFEPKWIYAVLDPLQRMEMDGMYGADTPTEFLREQYTSHFMMFSFYIMNNVSIDFRIFAGGVLFTLGAVYALGFNGIFIGAIFGYVLQSGNGQRLLTFVAGHSSFELYGMILCGVAGMRLGLALMKPGRHSRGDALRAAGVRAMPLLLGGAGMTFVAAFIEGFWSAGPAPATVKHVVGITLWVLLSAYLLFAGRRADAA
jgi:uncharacterized membrane protein SpoIIM required for sporulation